MIGRVRPFVSILSFEPSDPYFLCIGFMTISRWRLKVRVIGQGQGRSKK